MYYSLRNKNIERKKRRGSFLYMFLTIVTIVLFSFLGIKLLVNIINIITDIKKSDQNQAIKDTIPPRTPYIYPVSEFTSDSVLEIKGEAESGSTVVLKLNGKKSEVVAGNTGSFIFKLNLSDGENDFFLYSVDDSGNTGTSSKTYTVILDKTPPEITISSPPDKSTFFGTKSKLVEIKGISEADNTITINERYVNTSDNGSFIFKYDLNNGENKLKIVAKDAAGNSTEKELTLFYQE